MKGLSAELYEEYSDIISSINALKYLEAESNYSQAVEHDDIDVDYIEALKIEIDRLEAFKPTSSNIVLTVEQVRNKIELFIQTNDDTITRALANTKDISGFLSFKELIAELKKVLEEFIQQNVIEKVSCLYLLYLLEYTLNNTICIL